MQRELKFRAWDSQEHRMVEVNTLHFPETGTPYPLWNDEADKANAVLGRYKVQQFTGIKDKNGKEIYEGDILKQTPPNVRFHSKPMMVRWDAYLCGYVFAEGPIERSAPHTDLQFIEVIGNICETPELLGNDLTPATPRSA